MVAAVFGGTLAGGGAHGSPSGRADQGRRSAPSEQESADQGARQRATGGIAMGALDDLLYGLDPSRTSPLNIGSGIDPGGGVCRRCRARQGRQRQEQTKHATRIHASGKCILRARHLGKGATWNQILEVVAQVRDELTIRRVVRRLDADDPLREGVIVLMHVVEKMQLRL